MPCSCVSCKGFQYPLKLVEARQWTTCLVIDYITNAGLLASALCPVPRPPAPRAHADLISDLWQSSGTRAA